MCKIENAKTIAESQDGTFQERLDNFCNTVLRRKLWDKGRVDAFRKTADKYRLYWWERQLLATYRR